jgi:hypothetical protein
MEVTMIDLTRRSWPESIAHLIGLGTIDVAAKAPAPAPKPAPPLVIAAETTGRPPVKSHRKSRAAVLPCAEILGLVGTGAVADALARLTKVPAAAWDGAFANAQGRTAKIPAKTATASGWDRAMRLARR